jgi:hypothetical protein
MNPLSLHAILNFSLFFSLHFVLEKFHFVSFRLISFRFVSIGFVSFDSVSFRSVSFSFVSFRFVSFLFRFALYMYPCFIYMLFFITMLHMWPASSFCVSYLFAFMRTINHIILECPTFENLRVDFFFLRSPTPCLVMIYTLILLDCRQLIKFNC